MRGYADESKVSPCLFSNTLCTKLLTEAIGVGLYLAWAAKASRPWPAHLKAVMLLIAYTTAISGVALFSSYYQQASFKQMRATLVPMAAIMGTLLIQLSKLL